MVEANNEADAQQDLAQAGIRLMKLAVWLVFVAAAILEVGGDAVVRRGLRGRSAGWILLGCLALAGYGLLVNSVKWDFSKLLGVYVAFFALASILFGKFILRETIPPSTWLGLTLIIFGGMVIQFGPAFSNPFK
jgi:small multidrug resistance family-3 protein